MACAWEIRGPAGSTVALTFDSFLVESNYDFAFLYSSATRAAASLLAQVSGSLSAGTTYTSATGTLAVVFTSDYSVVYSGFTARWTITGLCVLCVCVSVCAFAGQR